MLHEKYLRDIRAIRERPKLRDMIVRENFLPDILRHHEKLYWDGASIRLPGGARMFAHENVTQLHLELKRLAFAGFWGDLRNVILDFRRHSQIRDTIDGKIRGVCFDVGLWTPPIDRIVTATKAQGRTLVRSSA
jgi:hypothetical protein